MSRGKSPTGPEGVSVIANGPLAGKSLRWLMENHAAQLLGADRADTKTFPLLVKILDAQDKLSLQVHPPAANGEGTEGRAEDRDVVHRRRHAERGFVRRTQTRRHPRGLRAQDRRTARWPSAFITFLCKPGDTMFLPSGRVHAIGAGNVIFEIQQNSDTTYRVFDWNRLGLDGKPREMHVAQSLASIDFNDFEPSLVKGEYSRNEVFSTRYLVDDPLFRTNAWQFKSGSRFYVSNKLPQIFGVVRGRMTITANGVEVALEARRLLPGARVRRTRDGAERNSGRTAARGVLKCGSPG